MNDEVQEILNILQEECAEVIQAISKCNRFGPDQCKYDSDITNMQHLQQELGDVLAMIELLVNQNVGVSNEAISEAKLRKFDKLKRWSKITIS
jgi:NTP pyrophosphatase (non-canonical NTP hydrolase)